MSKPHSEAPAPHCPLCSGSDAKRLVTKSGCDVVRCKGCGLTFVWPQPTPEELEAHYSAPRYHAEVDAAERRRYFATRLRQIEELVPRRGRVLDVGCAQGFFLEVACAEGWDAAGLDLDRKAVEAAQARGLDVRHGELTPATFAPESFDVVTLFDLIEHVREPRELLAAARGVLRPGGLLVVATPDISGLVPRATYALFGRTLGAWGHPTPPGHLVQFSRRTLHRMLKEEGLEPALTRREHIPLAFSVGKLENSIMDVLAGRHRTKALSRHTDAASAQTAPRPEPSRGAKSLLKRTFRTCVRGVVWTVVGTLWLVARATGQGDSMLIAAWRRP